MRRTVISIGFSLMVFAFGGAMAADWGEPDFDGGRWHDEDSNPLIDVGRGLGGETTYRYYDGSSTHVTQNFGGGTTYNHSDGSSTRTRDTFGGGTVYDHSDGSSTRTRDTFGGGTVYENSDNGLRTSPRSSFGGGNNYMPR